MSPTAALAGVRVLDLADESAAFAGRILADLGAEVIKVEPPEGSRTRRVAPFLDGIPGDERGFFHLYHDANKQSVVVDRSTREGRKQFAALVRSADVLLETAHPARRVELGLDPQALRAHNPQLIHASVTPFGPDGDWRDWRANDLVAGAASGLVWLSGSPGRAPLQGSANPAYTMASLAAATGAMVALHARETGDAPDPPPLHFDISLQEAACMAALQTATPTAWSWFDFIPGRPGLSGALRCKDGGWVALLVRPGNFEGFCEWVREAEVPTQVSLDDAHHAVIGAPREGNPVAEATLELAERLTRDEFAERAGRAEVVCLPVLDFPSMECNAHLLANEQFLQIHDERSDRALGFVRSPVAAMERGVELRRAPSLGEHSHSVKVEWRAGALAAARAERGTPLPALFDSARALAGVRVVDFCWVLAGPVGTRLLANFGADVIRIESSRHADGMRSQLGPDGKPDPCLGGLFNTANAGKRSISVDLRTERGRALVGDLIRQADVVTNNFRPGALERMGFGFDVLRELRPDIILLNLPGTHSQGPWNDRPTMGNVVMAASGFNPLMGFAGERPRGVGVAYPDFTSPYLLATTVLAALRERRHTGEGQLLDLSQLSATISLLGARWMEYRATGMQPAPAANRDPNYAPHGVYPARGDDEWVAIAVEGERECERERDGDGERERERGGQDESDWARFCRALERPDLARDARYANHAARKFNEDALDAEVARWTRERDRWQIAQVLQRAGVAAAPVEHLQDTFERDPQLRHHYQEVRHPHAPEVVIPVDREAIRFDGAPHHVQRGPGPGEHNEEIVCGLLGRSEDEYARLLLDDILV